MRRRLALIVVSAGLLVPLAAACGGDDAPPDGEEAGSGQQVYDDNCQTCHGPNGEGGVGPQLGGGAVAEAYPDIEDQLEVIRNGRNGMPAWGDELSDDQIRAVAEYEREELGQ